MSIQEKIAGSIMSLFGKAKQVEETVVDKTEEISSQISSLIVSEVKKAEQLVVGAEKNVFNKAHDAAMAANDEVNKLKASLQTALTNAANLHQAAVDAANAARAAAEADVAKFAAAASAHSADLATQSSAQTITPAAPAPAPVADAPAADASTPASSTPTQQ